jgi:hypothetical protein
MQVIPTAALKIDAPRLPDVSQFEIVTALHGGVLPLQISLSRCLVRQWENVATAGADLVNEALLSIHLLGLLAGIALSIQSCRTTKIALLHFEVAGDMGG